MAPSVIIMLPAAHIGADAQSKVEVTLQEG
jgi:hypothetical protein